MEFISNFLQKYHKKSQIMGLLVDLRCSLIGNAEY